MRHRQLLADGKDRWMSPDEDSNREGARQGAAGLVNDWLATDLRPSALVADPRHKRADKECFRTSTGGPCHAAM